MRTFSFDQFARPQALNADGISLVAKVWIDGDTYVVVPNPAVEHIAFRIAKQYVYIAEVIPPAQPTPEAEPLYLITVRLNSPCIRLDAGTINHFWSQNSEMAVAATARVSISFGNNGEGTLSYNGLARPCLGKSRLAYPTDLTVNVGDKYRRRYSTEFGVWMDFAVLIWGQRGIFIHEGPATLATNGGESAGCIHLAAPHAEEFFNWIAGRTRITIEYPV